MDLIDPRGYAPWAGSAPRAAMWTIGPNDLRPGQDLRPARPSGPDRPKMAQVDLGSRLDLHLGRPSEPDQPKWICAPGQFCAPRGKVNPIGPGVLYQLEVFGFPGRPEKSYRNIYLDESLHVRALCIYIYIGSLYRASGPSYIEALYIEPPI